MDGDNNKFWEIRSTMSIQASLPNCWRIRGTSPLPVSLDQSRKSYSNGLIANRFLEIAINSFNEPSCILYDRLSLALVATAAAFWPRSKSNPFKYLAVFPSTTFNSWFYELLRSLKLGEKAINAPSVLFLNCFSPPRDILMHLTVRLVRFLSRDVASVL